MTVESYIARMKEFGIEREGLEGRLKPFYACHPGEWHESAYLPGGYDKTIVPLKPAPENLTHLNPANVKRARKAK